jgi:urea transport system ATP-binding protein
LTLEGQHSLVVVEHDMKLHPHQLRHRHCVVQDGSVLAQGTLGQVQAC